MSRKLARAAAAVAVPLFACATAQAQQVDVIVSEIGPTSDVGVAGRAVDSMFNFSLSEDGQWWAGEFNLNGDTNTDAIHLRGSNLTVMNVIWQEATTPIPGVNDTFDEGFKARQTSVNNAGLVFGAGEGVATAAPDEFIYRFDGTTLSIVAQQGDAVPALPTEAYATLIDSPNSLTSGQGAWRASATVGALPDDNDDLALTNDAALIVVQEGVSVPLGQAGGGVETIDNFDINDYYVNHANTMFLYQGDLSGATATEDVVVFGAVGTPGTVVLQEGQTLPGLSGTIDEADQVYLAGNNWIARADQQLSGPDFIVRNGVVLAQEGDLAPNGALYTEHSAVTVDADGNYAWIWDTDAADLDKDELVVYNGTLLLTEGDTIMFDQGAGPAPAVIDTFQASDILLGGGYLYMMVGLDDLAGTSLGDAFIRVAIPEPGSLALLAIGSLAVMRRRRRPA